MIVVCIETNGYNSLTLNKKYYVYYSQYYDHYRVYNDHNQNVLLERKLFTSVKEFRKNRIRNKSGRCKRCLGQNITIITTFRTFSIRP